MFISVIGAKERGEAVIKREANKLGLLELTRNERKKLNKIIHNKEIIKKDLNKESTFYCCGIYINENLQCYICNRDRF